MGFFNRKSSGSTPSAKATEIKPPEDWATKDQPITGSQRGFLSRLASEAPPGDPVKSVDITKLTKAEASAHINRLGGSKK